MEEKEKILFTIFGIVAIIAVVGVIGIFNKPTYIIIPSQNFETEQAPETRSNAISGMVTYIPPEKFCSDYKEKYSRYAWFVNDEWFKEACEANYDLSEPEQCKEGYLDEYRCSDLDYLQRKWQSNHCNTGWRYFQYCKHGCSDGKCNSESIYKISSKADSNEPICTAKYLYDYKCKNDISQRLYRHADCRTDYKDFEICKKGCDQNTGKCNIDIKSYDSGFLDEYTCLGNYLKQKYQYSNGVTVYLSIERCNNGCSNNKCN